MRGTVRHTDNVGAPSSGTNLTLSDDETLADAAADEAVSERAAKVYADTKVAKAGNETIAGVKTFSSSPVVPDSSFVIAKTTGLQTALDGKASIAAVRVADVDVADAYLSPPAPIASSIAESNGNLNFTPFILPARQLVGLWVDVQTAGSTGALLRLGIYATGTHGGPGDLLLDAGTVDGTLTGILEKAISFTPPARGRYWLGCVPQGAPTTTPAVRQNAPGAWHIVRSDAPGAGTVYGGYYRFSVTGALPTPGVVAAAGSAVTSRSVRMGVRTAP